MLFVADGGVHYVRKAGTALNRKESTAFPESANTSIRGRHYQKSLETLHACGSNAPVLATGATCLILLARVTWISGAAV